MLKQPRSKDISCYFGEDPSLFGILFTGGVVVITPVGPVTTSYTCITRIACKREEQEKNEINFGKNFFLELPQSNKEKKNKWKSGLKQQLFQVAAAA